MPTQMGLVSNLRDLRIESYKLAGSIPSQLGLLAKMENLTIYDMPLLSGTIPSQLGLLTKMKDFILISYIVSKDPSPLSWACSKS